jgi:dienelactone hydrolase
MKLLIQLAAACGALVLSAAAAAQANPYQKGPDPTVSALEASRGPFAVGQTRISSTVTGFGGGTLHYPTAAGSYGLIAVAPPFIAQSSSIGWLGPRIASHGFVVVLIDVNSTLDFPESRSRQQLAAIQYAIQQSGRATSPVYNKVDPTRIGVSGHSMGGGATLLTARNAPANIKGAFPLTPWSSDKNFSNLRVPAGILACESDTVAANSSHSSVFYNSTPSSTPKAYYELRGESHFCPQSATNNPVIGKYAVAWFKRFVDNDERYAPFLSGALPQADLGNRRFSELRTSGL